MVTWLEIISRQFYNLTMPAKAPGPAAAPAPAEAGRLADDEGAAMPGLPAPEQLVAWVITRLSRDALAPLLDVRYESLTPGMAMHMMYLALAEMLGGNMPPVRIHCVRHLQGPPSVTGVQCVCDDPDCYDAGCLGNRLEIMHGQAYHMDPSTAPAAAPPRRVSLGLGMPQQLTPQQLPAMRMVLPHHKTEHMFGFGALEVELPCHLATVLHLYLTYARPVLMKYHDAAHGYVFMSTSSGEAPMRDAVTN